MVLDDDALNALLEEFGIGGDLSDYTPAIEPVIAALIDKAPVTAVRQAANEAVEALWDDDLAAALREQLTAVQRDLAAGFDDDRADAVDALLRELDGPVADNRVAHALIWHAVLDLMDRLHRNYEQVSGLEELLAHVPATRHRALTLALAATARPATGIDAEEAVTAMMDAVFLAGLEPGTSRPRREFATATLARALATDERRRSMREALADLADTCADEFPRVATSLTDLLGEPVPHDPTEDDLWMNLVTGIVEEQLAGALSAGD